MLKKQRSVHPTWDYTLSTTYSPSRSSRPLLLSRLYGRPFLSFCAESPVTPSRHCVLSYTEKKINYYLKIFRNLISKFLNRYIWWFLSSATQIIVNFEGTCVYHHFSLIWNYPFFVFLDQYLALKPLCLLLTNKPIHLFLLQTEHILSIVTPKHSYTTRL